MKEIPLTQGKVAIIDDDDFDLVSQYKWCYDGQGYAVASINGKPERMHRLILGAKPGEHVDHKNQDGLNNRRNNIRICNNSQNHMNTLVRSDSTSGYKGVSFIQRDQVYQSKICVNGRMMNLGSYDNAIDAAKVYDIAALAYFGEFAKTNFPEEIYNDRNFEYPRHRGCGINRSRDRQAAQEGRLDRQDDGLLDGQPQA